jgi:hypothetical protein
MQTTRFNMKWMRNLTLCATLGLSSCGALDGTLDKGGLVGRDLVTHTTAELGKLKTETIKEVKHEISELKTEILRETRATIEEMTPKVVESFLNAEAVAFLIVSLTGLLGFVVVVAGMLLLGAARALWKRLGNRSTSQSASKKSIGF